jgi:hypothetical protein
MATTTTYDLSGCGCCGGGGCPGCPCLPPTSTTLYLTFDSACLGISGFSVAFTFNAGLSGSDPCHRVYTTAGASMPTYGSPTRTTPGTPTLTLTCVGGQVRAELIWWTTYERWRADVGSCPDYPLADCSDPFALELALIHRANVYGGGPPCPTDGVGSPCGGTPSGTVTVTT